MLNTSQQTIAAELAECGFVALCPLDLRALIEPLRADARCQPLRPAGVGRDRLIDPRIRGDAIRWLDPLKPPAVAYLAWMEKLRRALNQRLFLGLFEYEAHYACYPPGAGYETHLDAFKGHASRVVSTVFYLNDDWPADAGGEVVLFDGGDAADPGPRAIRLAPDAGSLLVFLSADYPHCVLPATQARTSIAGWFRLRQ